MSDDESEEETEPAVELGDGPDVEGAPLSRVTARLTWGIEYSTPSGPVRCRRSSHRIESSDVTVSEMSHASSLSGDSRLRAQNESDPSSTVMW